MEDWELGRGKIDPSIYIRVCEENSLYIIQSDVFCKNLQMQTVFCHG